jgi:hypothetical protein
MGGYDLDSRVTIASARFSRRSWILRFSPRSDSISGRSDLIRRILIQRPIVAHTPSAVGFVKETLISLEINLQYYK